MKNRKNIYLLSIVILMVVALVVFFSYAYLNNTTIENQLPLTVTIEEGVTAELIATGTDFTALNVSSDKMLNDGIGAVSGTANGAISLSLSSPMTVVCGYDLYWVWDTDSDDYQLSKSGELEFTISGSNGTSSISETQVSNYNSELKLGHYGMEVNNGELIHNWNFTANFYNINANQDAHAEKTYKGKVEVKNAKCIGEPDFEIAVSTDGVAGTLPTENGYIPEVQSGTMSATFDRKYQRLVISSSSSTYSTRSSGASILNINYVKDPNLASYENLKTKVESINTTYNDGYRYVGKDPDNWIWFNNEMWRIIGSIPVCTSKADPTTSGTCAQADADRPRLVKIIRADSIGGLAFHSESGSNVWGNGNTLYTLLNSTYWGKGKVIGASPCLGDSGALATCNYNKIGISPDDYYGSMVEEVFMNVGALANTSVTAIAAYTLEIATVTKATHVGLMNASDYGYAADLVAANKTYYGVYLSKLNSYEQYNWLFGAGDYDWTMTPHSSGVMFVDWFGYVSSQYPYRGYGVRPVVYLDSSVYIIGGNGTATNPYIIGM